MSRRSLHGVQPSSMPGLCHTNFDEATDDRPGEHPTEEKEPPKMEEMIERKIAAFGGERSRARGEDEQYATSQQYPPHRQRTPTISEGHVTGGGGGHPGGVVQNVLPSTTMSATTRIPLSEEEEGEDTRKSQNWIRLPTFFGRAFLSGAAIAQQQKKKSSNSMWRTKRERYPRFLADNGVQPRELPDRSGNNNNDSGGLEEFSVEGKYLSSGNFSLSRRDQDKAMEKILAGKRKNHDANERKGVAVAGEGGSSPLPSNPAAAPSDETTARELAFTHRRHLFHGDHEQDDDEEPRPGAFAFYPSIRSSHQWQRGRSSILQHLGGNDAPSTRQDGMGTLDASSLETAEVHVLSPSSSSLQENHQNGLYHQRRKFFSRSSRTFTIILLAVVIIVLGVGLGVGLSNSGEDMPRNNTGGGGQKEDNSLPCAMDTILSECNFFLQETVNNDNKISLEKFSKECVTRHNNLKIDWLMQVHPSFLHNTSSCHPANLAFWALVTDSEDAIASATSRLQRFVLRTLFYSTGGLRWIRRGNWTSTTSSECDWFGVTCDKATLEVNRVILVRNNLHGTIPTEFALLTSLEVMNFRENFLSGTLSGYLFGQTNDNSLRTLNLGSNLLTGTLPKESFASLSSLERIWLYANELTGTVPSEVGLLSSLRTFSANQNKLVGTIPSEFGMCTNMKSLHLSSNNLEVGHLPLWLWNMTMLESIGLWKSGLSGTFPSEVSWLKNLTFLDFDENRLIGPLPSQLGLLTNMRQFSCSGNTLSGIIPTEFGLLTDLEVLSLSENAFTGNLPTELGLLVDLVILYFGNNHLSGVIPDEVCTLWDWNLTDFGFRLCVNPYGGLECPSVDCCRNCPHFA